MLCAVLGADGYADDNGHLKYACGHRLPLGKLIEYLVSRAADEVGVHKLDDRTSARDGITYGRADDRGFGNGRVEEAVIRQSLGKSAVNGERAAPIAVVLAVGDERGILIEFIEYRLKERVAESENLDLRDLLAVLVECEAALRCKLLQAGILLLRHENLGLAALVHAPYMLIREHDR